MAKPIRKTPTLHGDKADKFVCDMLKTEKRKINVAEKRFLELI